MALYLEQYLDNLQTLPGEVQRNLRLIRELDEKVDAAGNRVDQLAGEFVKDDKLSAEERRKRRDEIQSLLAKSKSWSEEKWQISMQLYEMVDKHIRRLDGELARFERDLKKKVINAKMDYDGHQSSTEGAAAGRGDKQTQADKSKTMKGRRGQVDDSSASENAPPSMKKKKKGAVESSSVVQGATSPSAVALSPGSLDVEELATLSGAALIQQLVGVGAGVMDMPVDPNEPVYCTCRQVSYGEMVGCDNQDCPIEWFHFGCVGVSSKPKGKWYCPMCKEAQAKKKASPTR